MTKLRLVVDLDGRRAGGSHGLDDLLDAHAGGFLEVATDGQGGEHDGQVSFDGLDRSNASLYPSNTSLGGFQILKIIYKFRTKFRSCAMRCAQSAIKIPSCRDDCPRTALTTASST